MPSIPARDFGPRLFTAVAGWHGEVFTAGGGWWWVPIVAPCIGGVVGAYAYDLCVGNHFPASADRTESRTVSRFILALDQGTTSSRAIVFRHDGAVVSVAQQEFPQIFPSPGHVEHDPEAIWESQVQVARDALLARGTHIQGHRGDRRHESARDDDRVGPRHGRSRRATPSSGKAGSPRRSAKTSRRRVSKRRSGRARAWCSTRTSPARS